MLSAMDSIYSTINSGIRYKQYHILGVFLAPYMPLLVKIANTGSMPHITSDSTSHIQSAANRAYHFQFDITSTSKRLPIGSRATLPNTNRVLPCQCPVCKVLKYTDVLGFGIGRFTTELLALHNALEMTRYTDQLQEACETLTHEEYKNMALTQLKGHPQMKEIRQCFDFVEIAAESHGRAQKKYSALLNRRREYKTVTQLPQKSLFGENSHSVFEERQKHVLQLMTKMERQLDA